MSSKIPFQDKLNYCLRENRIPANLTKDEALNNVLKRINVFAEPNTNSGATIFWKVAAAVLVLIIGSAAAYYFVGNTVVENRNSGVAEFTLPDGSEVMLNSNSIAYYNSSTWFLNREISLASGEAFFEVKKGETFTVETPKGNITVLGTSFNVSLKNENLMVACKTGKVQVDAVGKVNTVLLTPGKAFALNNSNLLEVSTKSIDAWTKGDYTFENVTILEVFKALESQTEYKIEMPEDLDIKYSGQFNMNLDIDEILEIVCTPLNLSYSINYELKSVLITKS